MALYNEEDTATSGVKRSYFDMEDDELLQIESEEKLAWRADKEESMSDWTVEITVDGRRMSHHRPIMSIS